MEFEVLPFAAPAGHTDGQQSLLTVEIWGPTGDRRFIPDQATLPPAAAISLGIPVPRDGWDHFSAYLCFLRTFTRCADYDEQRTYELLIEAGCPLQHADSAWQRFAQRVSA